MRLKTLAVTLLLFSMPHIACAVERGTRERAFVQALEQFDGAKTRDDYLESAKTLESILTDGFQSGAVFYNLGNAYFRAGEYGRAILNYRKAQPYRPRDPYLIANLEQARASAAGRLPQPAPHWWTHVLFWTEWFSYPTKVRMLFMVSSLGAVVMLLSVVLRRRRLSLLALAFLMMAAAIGVDAILSNPGVAGSSLAVITGETVARKGMGNSYEPAFDQPLRDGAEFRILNRTSDWTFGHFEGIGDGWVRNEFVAH